MPWNEVSIVSLRSEFVALANRPDSNISELCRRFGISRKTGYKWINRAQTGPEVDFRDQSKRPRSSPGKTPDAIEELILQQRGKHPEWGGRKLKRSLENEGHKDIPSPSTITEILRRHGLLGLTSAEHQPPWIRFEHPHPNDLWQMDFKGPIPTGHGESHALTVLDDHSRYSVGIQVCTGEGYDPTKQALTDVFRRYGLPRRITMDNGNPWGNPHGRWTQFAAWLIDLDIQVSYSRPYHPQTQGKDERFHRSLKAELLSKRSFRSGADLQQHCDEWRQLYNTIRPHDALDLEVPISRYTPSARPFPEQIEPFDYSPADAVRKVHQTGQIQYRGQVWKISEGFAGRLVGIRPTEKNGLVRVYYRHQAIAQLDLRVGNV